MKLESIVKLGRESGYNEDIKARFRSEAMKYLRAFAKSMNLNKTDYDIRYNAGGIAVSGEATLHHEKFYFQISDGGAMFRTCKGRKDYTGGANQWIGNSNPWFSFKETALPELTRKAIEAVDRPKFTAQDFFPNDLKLRTPEGNAIATERFFSS